MGPTLHVLFVCTGNICRSPIAERLTSALAERYGIAGLEASSAGTRAVVSHPVHREADRVLKSLGGSGDNFAARQLSARIATQADLIVTMTRSHRDRVLEVTPRMLHRTFTLGELAVLVTKFNVSVIEDLARSRHALRETDVPDIADPVGKDAAFFDAVGTQIYDLLPSVISLCHGR